MVEENNRQVEASACSREDKERQRRFGAIGRCREEVAPRLQSGIRVAQGSARMRQATENGEYGRVRRRHNVVNRWCLSALKVFCLVR